MDSLNLNVIECIINDNNWNYKGEGNANLIIALKNECQVLRIQKKDKNEMLTDSGTDIRTSILYYDKIILPLFTNAYFKVPKLGIINDKHVNILKEKLEGLRPASRKHKTISPGYVTIFQDLTLLLKHKSLVREDVISQNPVFCIEIKPKQGWYTSSDKKFTKCLFCLNQYLKLSEKSILNPSTYCPLDLFSGNKTRMLKCLKSLMSNPQNNMRIFRNGALVFGDNGTMNLSDVMKIIEFNHDGCVQYDDNLSTLIFNMLTQNLRGNEEDDFPKVFSYKRNCAEIHKQKPTSSTSASRRIPEDLINKLNHLLSLKTSPCNFSSETLPVNSILDKIFKIQQLDSYGADYVHHYFKANQEVNYIDYPKYDSTHFINDEFPRVLDPIECYLLSTMAKDVSIMITFQRLDVNLSSEPMLFPIAEDLSSNEYIFDINVVDVDAKPSHCIEKHKNRDINIVKAAINILKDS